MERALSLGRSLDYSDVVRGLRELNTAISFDAVVNRPSDYEYALKPPAESDLIAQREEGSGVYFNGRYVCRIDRGQIPELKLWNVTSGVKSIGSADLDKHDEVRVCYIEILPTDSFYQAALEKAQKHDDNYKIEADGRVFRYEAFIETKVPGRVIRVGWRHTFEALIRANIPGVTRESLGNKFAVDMYQVPLGDPEQVDAALYEE